MLIYLFNTIHCPLIQWCLQNPSKPETTCTRFSPILSSRLLFLISFWKQITCSTLLLGYLALTRLPYTHNTDRRSRDNPAELPPRQRVIADHVLNTVVETIHSERPRYRNALEEHQEQQTETTHSVWVQNLEHVHTTLNRRCNVSWAYILQKLYEDDLPR